MKSSVLCFVLAIVAVAVVHGGDRNVCKVVEGKKMRMFSFNNLKVKFPCKYPAIRGTRCGDWKVVVTPGNSFAYTRKGKNSDVYLNTMWLKFHHIPTGLYWKGRTSLSKALKYFSGSLDHPLKKRQGEYETSDLIISNRSDDKLFTVSTPDHDVKVTMFLWHGNGAWIKESGFKFECNSAIFEPAAYPKQLCGNGTKDEHDAYRRTRGMTVNEAVLYSVFTTKGIAQTNIYCQSAEDTMLNRCTTEEARENAIKGCWKLAVKGRLRACVRNNGGNPLQTFVNCLKYVCDGYPCDDPNGEEGLSTELATALDRCESFGDAAQELVNCHPDLKMKTCKVIKAQKSG